MISFVDLLHLKYYVQNIDCNDSTFLWKIKDIDVFITGLLQEILFLIGHNCLITLKRALYLQN